MRQAGERKHELAEEYLAKTQMTQGLFLILAGRAQAPVWDITGNHHIEPKRPMPYVNHYSFHILDPEWATSPLRSAAIRPRRKSRGAQNPRPIDKHYENIRTAMQGVFDELGLAA